MSEQEKLEIRKAEFSRLREIISKQSNELRDLKEKYEVDEVYKHDKKYVYKHMAVRDLLRQLDRNKPEI